MSEGGCILLVDDDPDMLHVLRGILTEEGYAVISATNGLQALEILAEGCRPCVILLDLAMLDGRQFLVRRSTIPVVADIPVLIMAATHDTPLGLRRRAKILTKPFAIDDLLRRIDEYC
jgi:putative two-component system response regulator